MRIEYPYQYEKSKKRVKQFLEELADLSYKHNFKIELCGDDIIISNFYGDDCVANNLHFISDKCAYSCKISWTEKINRAELIESKSYLEYINDPIKIRKDEIHKTS
ncbi:MAG: hypothetical protein FWC41_00190 [Firmicutes bacterium]|nr:hypothetical protein [Bacillota bacterium]